jgi:hypothetical protein
VEIKPEAVAMRKRKKVKGGLEPPLLAPFDQSYDVDEDEAVGIDGHQNHW